jgi:hypothetical protein
MARRFRWKSIHLFRVSASPTEGQPFCNWPFTLFRYNEPRYQPKEHSFHNMDQSNPSTPRFTLKLKTAVSSPSGRAIRASMRSLDTASQRRDSDSPSGFSGTAPSPPLPHPVANSSRPKSKLSQKPGAAWSDELKTRMQEDMDALMSR